MRPELIGRSVDDVNLLPGAIGCAPDDVDVSVAFAGRRLAIPLIGASMESTMGRRLLVALQDCGTFGIIPRLPMRTRLSLVRHLAKRGARRDSIVAVAVSASEVDEARAFAKAGATTLVLESANAVTPSILDAIQIIRELDLTLQLVVGNCVTARQATALSAAGIEAIKVGLGTGAACTTTERTGVGRPLLTAVLEIREALPDITLIADGGIRGSGDTLKLLAAGADVVCCGRLLAASTDAEGDTVVISGQTYRRYAGNFYPSMAVRIAEELRPTEGLEGLVEVRGSTSEIISEFEVGIRTGLAFIGSRDTRALRSSSEFEVVSSAPPPSRSELKHVRPLAVRGTRSTQPANNGQLGLFGFGDSADVGVAVLVWRDDSRELFLVGIRKDGTLALPGGHWSFGESLLLGARRELIEETGLDMRDVELASVHELFNRGTNRWGVTIGFVGVALELPSNLVGDGGLRMLRWISPGDFLREKNVFSSDKGFVNNVISGIVY